ncbi:structure-specific endonuclease subunit SLX4 [Pholidichthys leucotaenia]
MDDSEQDFVDICSKLLKRVRKKPGDFTSAGASGPKSSSQGDGERRRRGQKDGTSGFKLSVTQPEVSRIAGHESEDGRTDADRGPRRAKDKVLRMHKFKRDSPQKMSRTDSIQPLKQDCFTLQQKQGASKSISSELHSEPTVSDEAFALRLQHELDKEAAEAQPVDLEDGGLFFCQICQRDLSHMTPEGRTQHLNRCLDENEESGPAPPPPSGVLDCPICGKRFKSQKSRSTHLKRCSSEMCVPPTVLLQALQRQAQENQSAAATNLLNAGTKRKGPSKPGLPARKKPRKKTDLMDEETMVVLALSSSMLEQEREQQRRLQTEATDCQSSVVQDLKWRPDAVGKGRGKKRKGAIPQPPPLLIIQDAAEVLERLQERVSALLLRHRPPSPPTPTRCPSTIPGWSTAAPLWQKSTLLDQGSTTDYYAPELKEFFTPCRYGPTDAASFSPSTKLQSSVQPLNQGSPVSGSRPCIQTSSSKMMSCSPALSPSGQLSVGSQALRDLMDLAEDGMTLTQCGYTTKDKQGNARLSTNIHLSGFVQEESEEQGDLCASGFLPDRTNTLLEEMHSHVRKTAGEPGGGQNGSSHQSVVLSRLSSDLSTMVNNPQLSDVQLQVDGGEVYFAHSFMVYARCPLLAEMVHESGFGVREEGAPVAQRVLITDVPGQAVFTLLQYIYTAHCSVPASLQPHILELASRFDLQELQQLCQETAALEDDSDGIDQEDNITAQTDQAFMELLRSMWNEDDNDDNKSDLDAVGDEGLAGDDQANDVTLGHRDISEEQVNEEELEEIYEFASTQRMRREENDSQEEEEEERLDGEDDVTKTTKSKRSFSEKNQQPNTELVSNPCVDRSYSRHFSDSWGVYEEAGLCSPSKRPRTPHKPSAEVSGPALLQLSASGADNPSLSPPPILSNLPLPGVSPGQEGHWKGTGDKIQQGVKPDMPKEENKGPHNICIPCSPVLPQKNREPELIVLSDSSEEMEVVVVHLPKHSPSYTEIKSRQNPTPDEPHLENKKSSSADLGSDDPLNCSPEVSWLIPSTPMGSGSDTRSSSTQTRSSICRTRLFPKVEKSPPHSPSVFASPVLPFKTNSQTRDFSSDRSGPCRSPVDSNHSVSSCSDITKKMFKVPSSQPKLSEISSLPQSYSTIHYSSSTPLHTDLHNPSAPLSPSPLHAAPDRWKCPGQNAEGTSSESSAKTELGSFRLSTLSDHSYPSSSSSPTGHQSSQRQSKSFSQIRHSVESSSCDNITIATNEAEERLLDCSKRNIDDKDEQEEAGRETDDAAVADSSFRQSFVDEPPIAFNDSWGLDDCVDVNPGHFSLRLEDSGGSGQQEKSRSAASPINQSRHCAHSVSSQGCVPISSPSTGHSLQAHTGHPVTPSSRKSNLPEIEDDLLDSKIWDSWEEEDEEDALPLSQRVNPSAKPKTPTSSHSKRRQSLVPITPMPHYSDMDTPELKNKLNRFGVRPLPKRQMILKLKEIHQYTHQLVSSDSEDEVPTTSGAAQMKPPLSRPISCAQAAKFREPRAPPPKSPMKPGREEDTETLAVSQGSNTSSTADSEESGRSNPELCISSDGDSDSDMGISSSQAASRLQDRLQAVRSFILSNSQVYSQILQYRPLVLTQLQQQLKAAGIRLGAAKLIDYLDSQCITFTTAKPGHPAPNRRWGNRTAKGAKTGASRIKGTTDTL